MHAVRGQNSIVRDDDVVSPSRSRSLDFHHRRTARSARLQGDRSGRSRAGVVDALNTRTAVYHVASGDHGFGLNVTCEAHCEPPIRLL